MKEKAIGAGSLAEFAKPRKARAVWLMVPAGAVDSTDRRSLSAISKAGDILIDGGNSYYVDESAAFRALSAKGIHYVDVGTCGGVWGLERGYCMMIGGGRSRVADSTRSSRPCTRPGNIPPTPGREKIAGGTAEQGYLHCGQNGAGHFVKMVHNGIEYG